MKTTQRLAKNAIALYAAYIVTSLLTLLLTVNIARQLGDAAFGKFSFAIAFVAAFAVLLDLGFNSLIIRDVARDKPVAPKYLGNFAIIRVILSIIVFGIIALSISLMGYPRDTVVLTLIFGLYFILIAFAELFIVTFRAFERMEYDALVRTAGWVTIVSLGLTALFVGYGLIGVASAYAIGGMLSLLLSLYICYRKFARPRFEIDFDFWKKAARIALPIGLLSLVAVVQLRVDIFMLSAMKGDAVTGWYNAAYTLVLSLRTVPTLFASVLFPFFSRLYVTSQSSLRVACERAIRYLFILGLPLALGTSLLSNRIILLFYGDQFAHSALALQILAWDILLFFLYEPLAYVLVSIEKQNKMALAIGGCTLLHIVLNLVLIPLLSYAGAGISLVATDLILLASYFYLVSRHLCRIPLHRIAVRPIIACVGMVLLVYFGSGINLFLLIVAAVALYFLVLYLIGGVTKEDRELVSELISRSKSADK